MLNQIHTLPNLLVLAVVVALFGGAAFGAPFLSQRLWGPRPEQEAAVFDAFLAVMALAGLILGFSLVQADGNLRADEDHAGREASAIIVMDRTLERIGLPGADASRLLLDDFVRSQLRDEWPGLARQVRNPLTDRRFGALSRAAAALEPQSRRQGLLYGELIRALDNLSAARDSLIEDSGLHLPPLFWIVTTCFILLGLVLAALSQANPTRAAAFGVTAAGIGLLFSFVLIMDQPFGNRSSVSPGPIENALLLVRPH